MKSELIFIFKIYEDFTKICLSLNFCQSYSKCYISFALDCRFCYSNNMLKELFIFLRHKFGIFNKKHIGNAHHHQQAGVPQHSLTRPITGEPLPGELIPGEFKDYIHRFVFLQRVLLHTYRHMLALVTV